MKTSASTSHKSPESIYLMAAPSAAGTMIDLMAVSLTA
jgi:hypothetical protein